MVKKRDGMTCYHCRKIDENGHCDHLIPLSKGGTDSIDNLVWSCKECNLKKGNKIVSPPTVLSQNEFPNFSNVISSLVILITKWLIPPYPKQTYKFHNDTHYREAIMEMRQHKITTWLRESIWNTPPKIKYMIETVSQFDEMLLGLEWADKHFSYERDEYERQQEINLQYLREHGHYPSDDEFSRLIRDDEGTCPNVTQNSESM